MTDILERSLIEISELRNILGGVSTPGKSILVCNNLKWDEYNFREPYRSTATVFALCTQGELTMSMGVRKYKLTENCVMLFGMGDIIEIYESSSDFSANVIIFTQEFMREGLFELHTFAPIYHYLNDEGNDFMELESAEVEILKKYCGLLAEISEDYSDNAVYNLVGAMLYTVSTMFGKRVPASPRARTRQEEYFEKFLLTISLHYKEERSVQFYADELHVTPKYLSTVIKEISGRSAVKWIDEFVVREAKVLLRFSNKSIQEITYYLNFSTQSFFGKYFKRHTGMSPSQYRTG